ncbi:MAG: hydrogenase small subunit [Saprospiraceae bacterium]|nr:hydrogenase small subunit [Saprospiraceae bacterium]MCB0622454.1 hydrogenase small subunit [Saprospiraceae bacterium]MCB0678141.1 hydrogenase small subunit [Saprospiraceae bacterium]MCB0680910.1 hydrogenase small subunit [Saprospiraceae bacterium]
MNPDQPTTKRPTYFEELREKGYSRRDFMRFCTIMAAYLGLEATGTAQIAKALQTTPRVPVIWLHFQECTCCSESFIRSSHPIVADIILDKISLDYTETLMAASGHQAEAAMHETMKNHYGEYVLCVEGSVPTAENGAYCCIGGRSALDILQETAAGAKAVIGWGSCACNGCVQAAKPNPTSATPIHKLIKGKPLIKVPGCPPIGEVMAGVLVHIVTFGRLPELDRIGRPKAFYSKRVHDSCYRRPFYDAGLFVESFDDENAQKGYCLYKVGCKGPMTYNSCGIIKWNNGVSYPIQSGHGCIGCSEANFWDNGPFYRQMASFPGFGIESSADKVGAIAGAATIAGIAAHAVATNLRKQKMIDNLIDEGKESEKEL